MDKSYVKWGIIAIPKTFKPTLGEAPTPLADRFGINGQAGR